MASTTPRKDSGMSSEPHSGKLSHHTTDSPSIASKSSHKSPNNEDPRKTPLRPRKSELERLPGSPLSARRVLSMRSSPWTLDDPEHWGENTVSSPSRRGSFYQAKAVPPVAAAAAASSLGFLSMANGETNDLDDVFHVQDDQGAPTATVVATPSRRHRRHHHRRSDSSSSSSSSQSSASHSSRSSTSSATLVRNRNGINRQLEAMCPLISTRILDQALQLAETWTPSRGEKTPLLPTRVEFEGAVLFSDISGFARLAERLVQERVMAPTAETAAERLTTMVGLSLHDMIKVIYESGGDVVKFAGDAILAVYPADKFGNSLPTATLICAQVALRLSTLQLVTGKEKLSVHSGLTSGRIAWYQVGGEREFWHYFIAGAPVAQLGLCEHQAKANEVVISADARVQIEKISPIRGEIRGEGNFKLDAILSPLSFHRHESDAYVARLRKFVESHPESSSKALERILQSFLSSPVIFFIKHKDNTGLGALATEIRPCSTMFIKFRNFNLESDSPVDLQVVQYIVKELVTKIVLSLEGTVCRFSVDDKGALMLLAFGLIPYAHPNDSARAVKAAMLIRDGMANMSLLKPSQAQPSPAGADAVNASVTRDANNLSTIVLNSPAVPSPPQSERRVNCQIGITRGKVCVGMVGGAMRCEYTMHGVLVNRAARLMSAATDYGILCDFNTFTEASSEVEFGSPVLVNIKGEDKPVQVYVPHRKAAVGNQPLGPTQKQAISPHEGDSDNSIVIGRTVEKTEIERNLLQLQGEDPFCAIVGVQAEPGMGKSKLMAYILARAQRIGVHALYGFALDTEYTTSFFAWKPVVVQLITLSLNMTQSRMLGATSSGHTIKSFGSTNSGIVATSSNMSETHSRLDSKGSKSSMRSARLATVERSSSVRRVTNSSLPLLDGAAVQATNGGSAALSFDKSFVDMSDDERLRALINCLPLDQAEKYPILADILEGVIDKALMQDNEVTANLHGTYRTMAVSEMLVGMVKAAAARMQLRGERLIMIMEDLHFMDCESLSTINQLVKNISRLVLFISDRSFERPPEDEGGAGVSRDGEDPRVRAEELNFRLKEELTSDKSYVTILKLAALDENELMQCMAIWLNAENIPHQAVSFIAEKSAGNPLFSQELCYLLRENKLFQVVEGKLIVTGDLELAANFEIPNSIVALMTSNLDRIPADCQAVLRVASVIGMIFHKSELMGVMRSLNESNRQAPGKQFGCSDGELDALAIATNDIDKVLSWLVEGNYLTPVADNRQSTREKYQFRHVLLKDTVCELHGFEWKKILHNHVARYYESMPHDDTNMLYSMAHHYYLAGNNAQAKKYYEQCSEEGGHMFATQRVLECFQRLLEIAPDAKPLQRAIWSRRLGEAHLRLARLDRAEVALFCALETLGLDCRDADGFDRLENDAHSMGCCGLGSFWFRTLRKEQFAGDESPIGDEIDDRSTGSHTSTVASAYRRRLSVAEPKGRLQPRLVMKLPAMIELRSITKDRYSLPEKRAEAIAILLEASRCYSLLGEINKDRGSPEALERRLNAIVLAKAASPHIFTQGRVLSENLAPSRDAVNPRASAEIAKSFAKASVFFAGMRPETRWRNLMHYYGEMALNIQMLSRNDTMPGGESQDSETRMLLNLCCGEFAAFRGNFALAIEMLRYALWGYRFMHYDGPQVETQILILAVYFFQGDLTNCNMIASELIQVQPSASKAIPTAISACLLALCGEYKVAVQKLEQLVRSTRAQVKESGPLANFWPGMLQIKDANAFLAFSFIEWRQNHDSVRALKAALQAGIIMTQLNLDEVPLTYFHTAALVFTAMWDPIRDDPTRVLSSDAARKSVIDTLQRLLAVVRSYAIVYPVCQPHTALCVGLRQLIQQSCNPFDNGSFYGSLLSSSGSVIEAKNAAAKKYNQGTMWPFKREPKPQGVFYEVARQAEATGQTWVHGLALLECPDDTFGAWTMAYDIFSRTEYTAYELSRASALFEKANLPLPPKSFVLQLEKRARDM